MGIEAGATGFLEIATNYFPPNYYLVHTIWKPNADKNNCSRAVSFLRCLDCEGKQIQKHFRVIQASLSFLSETFSGLPPPEGLNHITKVILTSV